MAQSFPQISYDKMLAMPRGTVLEPLPYDANYLGQLYVRGASLGSLAINLAHGVNRINVRNDLVMFIGSPQTEDEAILRSYRVAAGHARGLAARGLPQHFNEAERAELSRLTGRTVEYAPAIVLGIQPEGLPLHEGATGEPLLRTQVPFQAVDPHSQAVLSEVFGVDVSQLPLTPGAQGPDFPKPTLYRPLGG
jgi:hypothetical protein